MLIQCRCGKTLRVADKLLGRKVRCPGCDEKILVQEEIAKEESIERVPQPSAKTRKRPSSGSQEDAGERDQPRTKKTKKAKKTAHLLGRYAIPLAVGGGAVVVVGVVLAILFAYKNPPSDAKQPIAQHNKFNPPIVPPSNPAPPNIVRSPEEMRVIEELKAVNRAYVAATLKLRQPPKNGTALVAGGGDQLPNGLDPTQYAIVWNIDPNTIVGSGNDVIVAYERKVPIKGGFAISADGSVRAVSAAEFGKYKIPGTGPYQVEILMGSDDFQEARQLSIGFGIQVQGQIVEGGSNGNIVKLHVGRLYTGSEKAVKAADLTRDFVTNREAALKKYRDLSDKGGGKIIVEGAIRSIRTEESIVVLDGH